MCTLRRVPGLLQQKHSEEQKTSERGSNTLKIAFLKGFAESMQAVAQGRFDGTDVAVFQWSLDNALDICQCSH